MVRHFEKKSYANPCPHQPHGQRERETFIRLLPFSNRKDSSEQTYQLYYDSSHPGQKIGSLFIPLLQDYFTPAACRACLLPSSQHHHIQGSRKEKEKKVSPQIQFAWKIQRFLIKVEIKGLSCVGASCHPHTYKAQAERNFS